MTALSRVLECLRIYCGALVTDASRHSRPYIRENDRREFLRKEVPEKFHSQLGMTDTYRCVLKRIRQYTKACVIRVRLGESKMSSRDEFGKCMRRLIRRGIHREV
ncbi:hypothetical protein Pla22_42350 [Rubripirellula amarantea]|uniref:Uncharacterized protein n=1 Tax=Rubripirellula amarantea TaxID=2527999 RepID=A0A5C5WLF1_9BACT|nr:hypothetical protein Pla22_42350 [Rubripirellula amarantea]